MRAGREQMWAGVIPLTIRRARGWGAAGSVPRPGDGTKRRGASAPCLEPLERPREPVGEPDLGAPADRLRRGGRLDAGALLLAEPRRRVLRRPVHPRGPRQVAVELDD